MNWWHKNPLEACAWFEEKFPERREWLRVQKINDSGLGTISIIWLEEWKDELTRLSRLSATAIAKWQKEQIDEEIHDWI